MPRIKIKTSTTTGVVPANGSLQRGELAANLADNKVWIGNASNNPVLLVSSMGNQDANNVAITGGSINSTSVTSVNLNSSTLTFNSGEILYYDEGLSATTANWNNATTYNMTDFGGLGNVTAHGWAGGPATYTLSLSGLPSHTEVRYMCYMHYVDSVDGETTTVSTMNSGGTQTSRVVMTKSSTTPPAYSTIASGTTVSWFGNRYYSYAPWGGSTRVTDNGGANGYVVIDTGWYSHSLSTFSAQHDLGANEAQTNEAQYISHVKLWIRGGNATYTSIQTGVLGAGSGLAALPTQNAIKSYVDTQLGATNTSVKNVYVYSTGVNTYNKSGTDVRALRVICVGAGGGGRGFGESGGAGGYAEKLLDAEGISSVTVTIGAGGAGGGYYGSGGSGGTTSFGSFVTASGGFNANSNATHTGGHGGLGSGGDINSYGGGGKGHNNGTNNPSNSATGRGGASFYGGSRNSHHSAPRPADHGAPGAGGSGSVGNSGGSGSNGRDGICIVYELR